MTPRRFLAILGDVALCIVIGVVLAYVLAHGWAGGFRP